MRSRKAFIVRVLGVMVVGVRHTKIGTGVKDKNGLSFNKTKMVELRRDRQASSVGRYENRNNQTKKESKESIWRAIEPLTKGKDSEPAPITK